MNFAIGQGRVLIVDDDKSMLLSLEAILSLDFAVSTATSVAEATVALESGPFDVVLTDYEMPGGSGMELIHGINERFPDVMVILLTGHPDVPEVQGSETNQAIVRLLTKPYDPRRLVQWVGSTVKLARMRQTTNRLSRRPTRFALVVNIAYPQPERADDFLLNLSPRGCFLRTRREVELGRTLELSISFPNVPARLSLKCEVRWLSAKTDPRGRGVGLTFEELPPATAQSLKLALAALGGEPR